MPKKNLERRTKNPSRRSSPPERSEAINCWQARHDCSSILGSPNSNPKQILSWESQKVQLLDLRFHLRPKNLLRYFGFDDWDLGFAAVGRLTVKIISRSSIPRTSCGGSSSNAKQSPARSRTDAVTSNGLPTVFVRPCMREATLTVLPIAVNSSRCGEPTLPTIAGPE